MCQAAPFFIHWNRLLPFRSLKGRIRRDEHGSALPFSQREKRITELARGLKEGMLTTLWDLFCVLSLFASHWRLGTSVFHICQVPHAGLSTQKVFRKSSVGNQQSAKQPWRIFVQCAWGQGCGVGNFPKLWMPGEAGGELTGVNCPPL